MVILLVLVALIAVGCGPTAPPLTADDYDASAPLNPRLDDGRLLYRGYDDHHPTCFVFVEEGGEQTEELECPTGALVILEPCPSGEIFRRRDPSPEGADCVCDPIGDDPPRAVACP